MIYIPHSIAILETEKYIINSLPPAKSYIGNAFIVEFKYEQSRKTRSTRPDKVHVARFVKQIYLDKRCSRPMWKWVCQGIAA
jgi:hypothetical protein